MTWPDLYYLDERNRPALERFLREAGWLQAGEPVVEAARAGQGNMNYVVRVQTAQRSFILKQSRPWVEKYPQIPAPFDRALVEAKFYDTVRTVPAVASAMPQLLAFDPAAHILQLADLGENPPFDFLYAGEPMLAEERNALKTYLNALHLNFRDADLRMPFANTAMRELNHEHIFILPFREGELQADTAAQRRAADLGRIYLSCGLSCGLSGGPSEGQCLVHGDFFPGSWIRVPGGIRVIDPEFCFFGVPEFDWGVMAAHFHLAGLPPDPDLCAGLDPGLVSGFAGIEIIRRLIGVARLPLVLSPERKRLLLEQAREMLFANG